MIIHFMFIKLQISVIRLSQVKELNTVNLSMYECFNKWINEQKSVNFNSTYQLAFAYFV